MAGNPKQKLKLLFIADYLRRYSDSKHAVGVSDIIRYLSSHEIEAERKSIYNDIEVLRSYGMIIERGAVPQRGYYLAANTFEPCELMLLISAVRASPVISLKRTRSLVDKLCSLTSEHQAKKLITPEGDLSGTKSENEEFYYNIDQINSAIMGGNKIRFIYHRRVLAGGLPVFDAGREFIISPYATIWNYDKFYVVGNYDKYDDLSHYRVDRMKKVSRLDLPVRRVTEIDGCSEGFDATAYSRRVFNMYAGSDPVYVELECEDRLLEAMIERFGINTFYRQQRDGKFIVRAQAIANEGFENWVLNFGGGVVVRSPADLRASIKEKLRLMSESYN